MTSVKCNRLSGEQMEWNSVSGECVDHQHVEVLWGLGGERGSRVSFYDIDSRGRLANVGEEVVRDGRDGWIDLVKLDSIAGLAVGCDGPHTQADDPDVPRATLAALMQSDADARIVSVVGRGRASQFIGEDLRAVLDGAVQEGAHGGRGISNILADT